MRTDDRAVHLASRRGSWAARMLNRTSPQTSRDRSEPAARRCANSERYARAADVTGPGPAYFNSQHSADGEDAVAHVGDSGYRSAS
jgi:hypothetical protein